MVKGTVRRKGRLLDIQDNVLQNVSAADLQAAVAHREPPRAGLPVHQLDVHLEKGMHCVDCHFKQDNHGNGRLYGAMIDQIEINCKDCHGTVTEYANLVTSNAKEFVRVPGLKWEDWADSRR